MIKSIAINSIDRAGFKKIFAYSMFLSIKSGVVVVLSSTTLKSAKAQLNPIEEWLYLAGEPVPSSLNILIEQDLV